ncbi:MAG: hypothetical protein JWM90_1012, partial [Thermoleophilia bacterium]|nr:hypothetical protein [Thermoleophilia bacterium]
GSASPGDGCDGRGPSCGRSRTCRHGRSSRSCCRCRRSRRRGRARGGDGWSLDGCGGAAGRVGHRCQASGRCCSGRHECADRCGGGCGRWSGGLRCRLPDAQRNRADDRQAEQDESTEESGESVTAPCGSQHHLVLDDRRRRYGRHAREGRSGRSHHPAGESLRAHQVALDDSLQLLLLGQQLGVWIDGRVEPLHAVIGRCRSTDPGRDGGGVIGRVMQLHRMRGHTGGPILATGCGVHPHGVSLLPLDHGNSNPSRK